MKCQMQARPATVVCLDLLGLTSAAHTVRRLWSSLISKSKVALRRSDGAVRIGRESVEQSCMCKHWVKQVKKDGKKNVGFHKFNHLFNHLQKLIIMTMTLSFRHTSTFLAWVMWVYFTKQRDENFIISQLWLRAIHVWCKPSKFNTKFVWIPRAQTKSFGNGSLARKEVSCIYILRSFFHVYSNFEISWFCIHDSIGLPINLWGLHTAWLTSWCILDHVVYQVQT